MASELESDLQDTVDWGSQWLVDFNTGKSQLVSFDWFNITGAIEVKICSWGKISSFKILGLTFPSKLDWSSYNVSVAKSAFTKIGALIHSMKLHSPKVALYFYKSIIQPCMEYCCHVWAFPHSCYLELLYKLQKQICRTVSLSLAALFSREVCSLLW